MKISYGKFIRDKAIENLILAQERIAEKGNATEIIFITKFILKSSKKLDNHLLDLGFEKDEQYTNAPPNKNEQKDYTKNG